jgi:hypothetical protein
VPSFARLPFLPFAQQTTPFDSLLLACQQLLNIAHLSLSLRPHLFSLDATTSISHTLSPKTPHRKITAARTSRAAGPYLLTVSADNSSKAPQSAPPPRLTTCPPLMTSASTAQEDSGQQLEPSEKVSPTSPQILQIMLVGYELTKTSHLQPRTTTQSRLI